MLPENNVEHTPSTTVDPYKNARFGRVITAMVTPFDGQGELNLDAAQELASYLESTGSEGLAVAGTTGESPTLNHHEHVELIRAVHDAVSIPVLAGTGSNSTREALELTGQVTNLGCAEGLLVVSPYYNRPSQHGIEDYFQTVAGSTDLPIVMYDIPVRTGREVAAETINRLATIENIVGLKDAAGNGVKTTDLLEELPSGFEIYSGDDSRNLELYSQGAAGAISVASHWAAREIIRMFASLNDYDIDEASTIEASLQSSYAFESSEQVPNPHPAKAMMRTLGQDVGRCRSPMVISLAEERALEARAQQIYEGLTHALPSV